MKAKALMTAPNRRRRMLFLTPVVPADRGNGLAMRAGFFLDAYSREFDVDLAIFPIVSAPASSLDFARRRVGRMEIFPHPGADSHFALVTSVIDPPARLAAFRRYGRPSLAGFANATALQALAGWTAGEHYDAVHVFRLYIACLAETWTRTPAARRPRLVIDCDEDDGRACSRIAAIERKRGRQQQAAWAEAEADAFANLARDALPRFDLVFAASANEAKTISEWTGQVVAVPNVALTPVASRRPRTHRKLKTVLFVGTMGYAPNDDGARWLVTRIWPRLCLAFRSPLRLVVVGSNPSASLVRLGRRPYISVTGTVHDVGIFYRQADLAVIPIRAGGGTRIKLLEAAAWGVPVVSTRFGASGTTFRHGRELLIADDAEKFARACAALLQSPNRARRLAAAARRRISMEYDADRWARHVARLVAELHAGDEGCREQQGPGSNAETHGAREWT
jgi:glycosyltransferase involved in cell wall biosynthesis